MRGLFHKTHPKRRKSAPAQGCAAIDPKGRRLLGLTLDGRPIWAPEGHSLLLAANGAGKTSCGCLPWLFSLVAAPDRPALLVIDPKNGEMAAQCAPMLAKYNIPVAMIDDMGVFDADDPYRVALNPLGAVTHAFDHAPFDVSFATETANHALLPDPAGGPDRNQFFRDGPRTLIEFCQHTVLTRTPEWGTPGGVWLALADPAFLERAATFEATHGSGATQKLALDVLDSMTTEYHAMHRAAALKALRVFAEGGHLHKAGREATTTHADLIRQRAVIFLVGPQQHMARLASYVSLHLAAFLDALYRGAGPLTFINDEFSNTPLKAFVDALTTIRGFGGTAHNIAQSRSEVERKFGTHETHTIEENAIVKQWFGFSSFEEAERVSKAMGEALVVQHGLNLQRRATADSALGLSLGRQRHMTAAELMAMPRDRQLIHVKGVGFFVARKIAQNHIAPFCYDIANNPLEGGRLPPDPKLTLKINTHETTR